MAKFGFNLREASADRDTPINLIVRYSGERVVFPTQEVIHPKQWDGKNHRVREDRRHSYLKDLNGRLDFIELEAKKCLTQYRLQYDNQFPTPERFRELLRVRLGLSTAPESKEVTLFGFIDRFIQDSQDSGRVGEATLRAYRVGRKKLQEFVAEVKSYRALNFENITLDFYHEFTSWLVLKGFSANYIGNHIKFLKAVLNEATERGINTKVDFRSRRFKKPAEDSTDIHLNEEELRRIEELDLSSKPRLDRVRDLFLVGCWTGLRFSDFTRLTLRNLKKDGEFIEIEAQKTGRLVVIPVHHVVRAIFDKYQSRGGVPLPPAMSNQKMNDYLKELAQLAGINEEVEERITKGGQKVTKLVPKWSKVSTHTARRSFATNLYERGVDTISIRAITGHGTETAFLKYIKTTPHQHAQRLQELWKQQRQENPFRKVS